MAKGFKHLYGNINIDKPKTPRTWLFFKPWLRPWETAVQRQHQQQKKALRFERAFRRRRPSRAKWRSPGVHLWKGPPVQYRVSWQSSSSLSSRWRTRARSVTSCRSWQLRICIWRSRLCSACSRMRIARASKECQELKGGAQEADRGQPEATELSKKSSTTWTHQDHEPQLPRAEWGQEHDCLDCYQCQVFILAAEDKDFLDNYTWAVTHVNLG